MAKRDHQVVKWHQKQFENSNENKFVSQRSSIRESKQRHKELRALIKDKFWFDSLTFDDKEFVVTYWYFHYKKDGYWYSDDKMCVREGETREEYCKRNVPGDKHTQRDMKLNKLLS
jgi:hypothetical protein